MITLVCLCLELTGANCAEWSSLFNGQLDDINSPDPMTGVQNHNMQPDTTMFPVNPHPIDQPPHIDRYIIPTCGNGAQVVCMPVQNFPECNFGITVVEGIFC